MLTCFARVLSISPVVREVELDARPASDLQRLGNATTSESALTVGHSRLRHVDAPGVANNLAELDQLIGARPRARIVAGAGRETDRALLDALADKPFGGLHGVPGQRPVVEAHNLQPDRAVRHQIGGVDGDFLVVVCPERGHAAHVQVFRRLAQQPLEPAAVDEVVLVRQRCV